MSTKRAGLISPNQEGAYNPTMRCRLAQIVVFVTSSLLVGSAHVHAQPSDSTASCRNSGSSDTNDSPGPEISIVDVTFLGSLQMPISEQEEIVNSIKQKTYGTTLGDVVDEGLERVRAGWQDRGYFKVQVTGDARTITSSPASQHIALSVSVDEGSQYRLSGIAFKNNKAIKRTDILRAFFPIADDELFSREKIGKGLENLRQAYGELGYINFTPIPDTEFDDENRRISLVIDIDEGKQFRVSSVDVLGLDEISRREILNDFPIGGVYSQRLFEELLLKHHSILRISWDDPSHIIRRLDEKAGTVALTLDARPCPQ